MKDIRAQILDAMQANDPNGCWSDSEWIAEGMEPMTADDLANAIAEQVHTDTEGEALADDDGSKQEAVIAAYEIMRINDFLPCNISFVDDLESHNTAVDIFNLAVDRI